MSDFEELRKRVEAAGRQFSAIAQQRRDYGQRLIDMIAQHERDLAENQARMAALRDQAERARELAERRAAELQGVRGENEQLRQMLHSLLQAIESGRPNDFEETMHELDRRISTMIEGAGTAFAMPRADEPVSEPASTEEDDLPPDTAEWEQGEPADAAEAIAQVGEAGWASSGIEAEEHGFASPPSLKDVFLKVGAAAGEAVPRDIDQEELSGREPDASEDLLDETGSDAFALKQSPISAIADSIVAETRGRAGRFDLAEEDPADGPGMGIGTAEGDERPFDLLEEAEPSPRGAGSREGEPLDRLFDENAYDDGDGETLSLADEAAAALREEVAQEGDGFGSENEFDLSDLALGGEIQDRLDDGFPESNGETVHDDVPGRLDPDLEPDPRSATQDHRRDDVASEERRPPPTTEPVTRRGSLPGDSALQELEAILAEEDFEFATDSDVAPPEDALDEFPAPRAPQRSSGPLGTVPGTAPALREDLDEISREEILAKLRQSHRRATESGRN